MDFVIENEVLKKYVGDKKSVVIPNEIKKIDKEAFRNTKIEEVLLNEGLEEIDDYAFKCCKLLKRIKFPKTLKRIGRFSFSECFLLREVNIENVLIDDYSFQLCNELKRVNIIDCKIIKTGAFYSCCKLKSISLRNVLEINDKAFCNCKELTKVNGLNLVKKIGLEAFSFTKIKKLDLYSTTHIGQNAFFSCNEIKKVSIKSAVEIDSGAFSNCKSLLNIFVDSKNPFYSSKNGVLYNKSMNYLICYPIGRHDSSFKDDSVTKVFDYGFYNCKYLQMIDMPELKEIGIDAFSNCTNLRQVSSNIKIKYESFVGCKYLTKDNID